MFAKTNFLINLLLRFKTSKFLKIVFLVFVLFAVISLLVIKSVISKDLSNGANTILDNQNLVTYQSNDNSSAEATDSSKGSDTPKNSTDKPSTNSSKPSTNNGNQSGGSGMRNDPITSPPAVLGWQAAFNSRSQSTIESWFNSNIGHTNAPDGAPSLWNLGSGVTDITDSWLVENNGNGHVRQESGRWIVDSFQANQVRIRANNVTLRRCLIQGAGSSVATVRYYTSGANPSAWNGAIVEYCTLNGQNATDAAISFREMSSSATTGTTAIVRYTEVFGYRRGFNMTSGTIWEYNYVHDLYYYTGSHNTSSSLHGGNNVAMRRNLFDDGNSSAVSLYAETPTDNITFSENVFNTTRAHYCINFPGDKPYSNSTTNTRLSDNIFGQKYYSSCGLTNAVSGIQRFSNVSGNTYMDGGLIP